jgi:hypothetical protein
VYTQLLDKEVDASTMVGTGGWAAAGPAPGPAPAPGLAPQAPSSSRVVSHTEPSTDAGAHGAAPPSTAGAEAPASGVAGGEAPVDTEVLVASAASSLGVDVESLQLILSSTKPCPSCLQPLQRIAGCNHVRCGVCRHRVRGWGVCFWKTGGLDVVVWRVCACACVHGVLCGEGGAPQGDRQRSRC